MSAEGNALPLRDARAPLVLSAEEPERENWERHSSKRYEQTPYQVNEPEALVKARRGQGQFRTNIAKIEHACRITVSRILPTLLRVTLSHGATAPTTRALSPSMASCSRPRPTFFSTEDSFPSERSASCVPVADEESLVKLGVDPDRPPASARSQAAGGTSSSFIRRDVFRAANVR